MTYFTLFSACAYAQVGDKVFETGTWGMYAYRIGDDTLVVQPFTIMNEHELQQMPHDFIKQYRATESFTLDSAGRVSDYFRFTGCPVGEMLPTLTSVEYVDGLVQFNITWMRWGKEHEFFTEKYVYRLLRQNEKQILLVQVKN